MALRHSPWYTRQGGTKATIGSVLVDTAAALRKLHQSLVVDATAFDEAAVGPEAAVVVKTQLAEDAAPPWMDLGLTALYTPSGWLLTTRRELNARRDARRSAVPSTANRKRHGGRRARAAMPPDAIQPLLPGWMYEKRTKRSAVSKAPQSNGRRGSRLRRWQRGRPECCVQGPVFEADWMDLDGPRWPIVPNAGWRWKATGLGLVVALVGARRPGVLWLPVALQGVAPGSALGAGWYFALVWRLRSGARALLVKPINCPKRQNPNSHAVIGVGAVLVLFALSSWGRPADSDDAGVHDDIRRSRPGRSASTNTLSWRRRGCSNGCTV